MNYLIKTKDNIKVIFKEAIQINNRIIKKEQLNFVLGSLLYLKKLGNFVAHPNIKSEIEAEINDFTRNMKMLKNLVETNPQAKNTSEYGNGIINSNLKTEIKKKQ